MNPISWLERNLLPMESETRKVIEFVFFMAGI